MLMTHTENTIAQPSAFNTSMKHQEAVGFSKLAGWLAGWLAGLAGLAGLTGLGWLGWAGWAGWHMLSRPARVGFRKKKISALRGWAPWGPYPKNPPSRAAPRFFFLRKPTLAGPDNMCQPAQPAQPSQPSPGL